MTDRISSVSRWCQPVLVVLCTLAVFASLAAGTAQAQNPLAGRLAATRVTAEEIRYLQQMQETSAEEIRARTAALNAEGAALRGLMRALPREVQAEINQQSESLFQTRIVPLRQQWAEALAQKRNADQARFNELSKELQTDAAGTGKIQAERTLLRERAQRGEVSQADAARTDQQLEQQILAVRRKYDALDDERARLGLRAYWAATFTRAEAGYANKAVADARLRLRLDDTQSEIGRDAHQAADLTLRMQRNQFLQAQQVMSPQEAQSLNANVQVVLTALQQKYAALPTAGDYRDRVARLVQEGAVAQRPQWERDVAAARDAAARRAATAAPVAPAATPQPAAVPVDDPFGRPGQPAAPAPSRGGARPRPSGTARTTTQARVNQPIILDRPMPRPEPAGGGLPWSTIGLLLLVGGGGAGYYVMRSRKAVAPMAFKAAPTVSVPQEDPAPLPLPGEPSPATPVATGQSLKDELFTRQREKYQARYNDALDEVTYASAALAAVTPLLETAHLNVYMLSKSMYDRMQAAMTARYGGVGKALVSALWLRPLWRFFRQVTLWPKVGIGIGVLIAWNTLAGYARQGEYGTVLLVYGAIVAAGFFLERRLVLKAPLAVLKRNEAEFKTAKLLYTFADQRPEVINGASGLHGMWIQSTDPGALAHAGTYQASVGTDVARLAIGQLAMFRVEPSGTITLTEAAQGNQLIRDHGDVLTGVVTSLGDFGRATIPPLQQYAEVLWRKTRAAAQLPQLEALVRDVDRIEGLWRDTYVSDDVFQFLFRSIDMFNMRDAATPPGLLLYGTPGNGKKHLAKKIADTLSARFEEVTPGKIASADHIAALWELARGGGPVVLFVPNAETLFPKSADGTSARDTLEWIAEWEKHEPRESRVWVIMTAKQHDAVDAAIVDHVGRDSTIEIKTPDGPGRLQLLRMFGRQLQVTALPSEPLLKTMGGTSVQDLRRVVMAAKRAASPAQPQETHWKQAIQTVRGADAKYRDDTKTWDRLILPDAIKDQLKQACRVLQEATDGKKRRDVPKTLLWGPPGTGKTEIARTIANEAGVNFMEASLADMKGEHIGKSGQMVKAIFAKARSSAPTVLFLDEIDVVVPQRGSGAGDVFTEDILNVLLTELEGAAAPDRPVFVLAATNLPETIDTAILSRFRRKIEIPLPDEAGRRAMLQGFLHEREDAIDFDIDEVATALARRTDGQAGRQLRDIVRNAYEQAEIVADATEPPSDVRLTAELLEAAAEQLVREGSDGVDPTARWNTLVVSDETLAQLHELSDALRHLETLQRQGIDPPRGAVLWGPPGTGKTQIAKTLANESGVRFLLKGPSDLGHTAESVRKLFSQARAKAPCILFIDEFENAGKSREQGGSAEVVTELLSQMQGAKKDARPVFVLAATNFLNTVDDALLSRFTYRIEVPNPGVEQREKLFQIFLNKVPHEGVDVAAISAELARKGGGLAGRDINDVVVRATQAAAQRALRAGTPDKVRLTGQDLLDEVAEMLKTRNVGVDPSAKWDTLVVSDDTLRTLKQVSTALRNMEDRLKQGVAPPRGAVLFGPPGTGKTQIAKTLANESGVNYHFATAKDLVGQYVGESTQKVAKLFAEARKKAPCILFLDEFEAAAAARSGSKGSGFKDEVVPQLLAEMDGAVKTGRAVFVLAATNHLEQLDPAVVSRFTYQIEIPNPTPEQRERLFTVFLKKVRKVDFDVPAMAAELAGRSGELAGRQIYDFVEQALQDAAQRADDAGGGEIVLRREDLLRRFEPKGRAVTEDDLTSVWSQIVLEPAIKDSLLSMIRLFNSSSKASPKGLLLYGPPGTGKTEIARLLAKSTGCEFLATDLSKLKGSHVGESGRNVRELWEKARVHGRAVIFVDECDGVFALRGGVNTDAAVEEINNAFLPMWDGLESKGQIWVVGATNKRERIDEAMVSRFGELIKIDLPGAPERVAILRLEMQKLESSIPVPEFVGNATGGFSGRNLSKLASSVFRKAAAQGGVASDDVWREAIQALATVTTDDVDASAAWDTLILPDPVMKRLQRISRMLAHAETLRAQGADVPRAALLFGPPGTGKTQIAKTLANESKLNFIAASPSDIKGAHLGESGKLVKELFERARSKPTVLFIDEIESTAASRNGGRGDQYTVEIVNELLTQMDGVKKVTGTVFVLAATNYPDLIDDAVLSRFEDRIEIPNPGPDERKRMLATFIGKRRVDFDVDALADELGPMLDGLSGRALMALVRRASQSSAERAIDANTPDQIVMSREDVLGALSVASR